MFLFRGWRASVKRASKAPIRSLSRPWEKSMRKAANAKERQQVKKEIAEQCEGVSSRGMGTLKQRF